MSQIIKFKKMKTKILSLVVVIVINCISCKQSNHADIENISDKKNPNALLWDKVIINDIFNLYEGDPDHSQMIRNDSSFKNLKRAMDVIFDKVKQQKIEVYETDSWDSYKIKQDPLFTEIDTLKFMSWETGEIGAITIGPNITPQDVEAISFREEWYFDAINFKMEKDVIAFCPVKKYFVKVINRKWDYHFFKIKNNHGAIPEDINYELLASNVKPRFNVLDPKTDNGMDGRKFIDIIIDKVIKGGIQTYDPLYLIDFKKRPFTKDELNEYCDGYIDEIREHVSKVVFVEDWYFNKKNLSIKKKVKGIALVHDSPYKVLFVVFFNE